MKKIVIKLEFEVDCVDTSKDILKTVKDALWHSSNFEDLAEQFTLNINVDGKDKESYNSDTGWT